MPAGAWSALRRAGLGAGGTRSLSHNLKLSPHAMMTHAAKLKAQDPVCTRICKAKPQAVDISGHSLDFAQKLAGGRIDTEAMIDIKACHSKFHERASENPYRRCIASLPPFFRAIDGLIRKAPGELHSNGIDNAVGCPALFGVGRSGNGQQEGEK